MPKKIVTYNVNILPFCEYFYKIPSYNLIYNNFHNNPEQFGLNMLD